MKTLPHVQKIYDEYLAKGVKFAQAGVPRVYLCKDGIIKNIFTDQPENPTYGFIKEALERLF